MALKIQGNVIVDASREEVWNLLFDMQFSQQVLNNIPGITVEKIVQVAEDRYEAAATMGVAMVRGKYAGTIAILKKRVGEFITFTARARAEAIQILSSTL
jgi:uncharacterized protein